MTDAQRLKNLSVPHKCVDVVLDTDTYNEIDDQYALAYLLRSKDKLNTQAIYAAPFKNEKAATASEGMEKSYEEILKILDLIGETKTVLKGSNAFLRDEDTPVVSPAALDLVSRAKQYSPENPLYVVAIGAITNVASALLLDPDTADNIVVVWLGGNARHFDHTKEFNMIQDIAAARVVMNSGTPFVQLPCGGVVSAFRISEADLRRWFVGKNAVSSYLALNTIQEAETYAKGMFWTRIIWDVVAVAWLLNEDEKFMFSEIRKIHLPNYQGYYENDDNVVDMRYIFYIKCDELWRDVIDKITG